jgi:hypothetical protein
LRFWRSGIADSETSDRFRIISGGFRQLSQI